MAVPLMDDPQRLEIALLFEALYQGYGWDFRNYAYASARRRVLHRVQLEGLASVGELQHQVLHQRQIADRLLRDLSINVTEMFRDPSFCQQLRQLVFPTFTPLRHLRIWHAGCASGEEVYSMAILLEEAGLYERSQLYATDFNGHVLEQARRGIFPINAMRTNVRNYHQAGGTRDFTDYYHARYEGAAMASRLQRNMQFSRHDLVSDGAFAEMQMIVCRNVLIYFDRQLQERVFKLLSDSLCEGGFLCLGSHESLQISGQFPRFDVIDAQQRIYRKKGQDASTSVLAE
jgi:chemotaxis protein methyltransferase CheR